MKLKNCVVRLGDAGLVEIVDNNGRVLMTIEEVCDDNRFIDLFFQTKTAEWIDDNPLRSVRELVIPK